MAGTNKAFYKILYQINIMRMLAGSNPWLKILIFFVIIPLAISFFVFTNLKHFVPDVVSLGISIFVFVAVYAIMTKFVMMV